MWRAKLALQTRKAPSMSNKEVQSQLESLVNQTSFVEVLRSLSDVACDKAEHLNNNWQDSASVQRYLTVAKLCGDLAKHIRAAKLVP